MIGAERQDPFKKCFRDETTDPVRVSVVNCLEKLATNRVKLGLEPCPTNVDSKERMCICSSSGGKMEDQ